VKAGVVLPSTSRAQDLGYLALKDVDAITSGFEADYRLVGGHMVALLIAAHDVIDAPERETADADLGADFEVVADPRLPEGLKVLGYARVAGNRFTRRPDDDSDDELVIDILAPSGTGLHEPNQEAGDLVVDAIPGLSYALAARPAPLKVQTTLTTGEELTMNVLLPNPLAALCLKLLAYNSRSAAKDAVDIWRLLEVARVAGVGHGDWPDPNRPRGARGDALRQLWAFAAPGSRGLKQASADERTQARIRALASSVAPARP
jgi:hypothetical protein